MCHIVGAVREQMLKILAFFTLVLEFANKDPTKFQNILHLTPIVLFRIFTFGS